MAHFANPGYPRKSKEVRKLEREILNTIIESTPNARHKDRRFQKLLNLRRNLGITEPLTQFEIDRLMPIVPLAMAFVALDKMIKDRDAGEWD